MVSQINGHVQQPGGHNFVSAQKSQNEQPERHQPNNQVQKRAPAKHAKLGVQFPIASNNPLQLLQPLLKGLIFYKKFSNQQSVNLSTPSFDPLAAEQVPPENCGFGIRLLQLDESLKYIRIKQNLKNTIENQFAVVDLVRVILPNQTAEIIKIQKQNKASNAWVSSSSAGSSALALDEKKDGTSNSKRKLSQKDIKGVLDIFEGSKHQNISHLAKIGVLQAKNKSQRDLGLLVR